MDPLNPEWNFLKDLLGEKPPWEQQEKQSLAGQSLVAWSPLSERSYIVKVRTASWSKALARGLGWNSTCESGDGKAGWVQRLP